jgi:hypothetical protein
MHYRNVMAFFNWEMQFDQGRPSPLVVDNKAGRTRRYGRTSLLGTAAPSRLQVPPPAATDLLGL